MRTAAAKGKGWRLIAAALAALVGAGVAEASRISPASANDLLKKHGTTALSAASHATDPAVAFVSAPTSRFPLLTTADRQALTAPLAVELARELDASLDRALVSTSETVLTSAPGVASADLGAEKLASGPKSRELRPNLWLLRE